MPSLSTQLFLALQEYTGIAWVDQLMVVLAEFSILVVPIALVWLWLQGKEGKKDSIYIFGCVLLALLLSFVLGSFYYHPSPFQVYETVVSGTPENAFPSTHGVIVFSAFLATVWKRRRKLSTLLGVAALATGFARIYVGEHYPIDMLGSLLAALVALVVVYGGEQLLDGWVEKTVGKLQEIETRLRNR